MPLSNYELFEGGIFVYMYWAIYICHNIIASFVPRLFHESDIALIFSSGKQFLDSLLQF